MFFAQNQDIQNIQTYLLFIKDIIQNNQSPYKQILVDILTDAKKLYQEKNYFSVNQERFDIIVMLSEMENVSTLNIENKDDINKVLNFIQQKV